MKMKFILKFLFFFCANFSNATVIQPTEFEVSDNSKLVIFGEEHKRPDLQELMFEYIDKLNSRDKAFDCFFSEFDISAQEKINQFLSGELVYEESILPFASGHLNLLPKSLASSLKSRELKVIPVDFEYKSEQGERLLSNSGTAKTFVEKRSLLMAENILNVLKGEECKRGVFLVGQVHTWKHAFEEGNLVSVKSVQDYFKDLNISAEAFLLHNNRAKGVTRLR